MSEVLRWQNVKNRKPCKCRLCGRTIPAGENMISAAWAERYGAKSFVMFARNTGKAC